MTTEEKPRRDVLKVRVSIARSLRDIEQLALDLHAQALNSPNDSTFPGGTALHMLGPAASIAVWEAQYEATEDAERWDESGRDTWAKRPKLDPAMYQGDTEDQPLNVLESWTRMIREDRGQPTGLTATISRECDYLRKSLDWACRVDEYDEPVWPLCFEMADELRTLVRRMEDVLHDGLRWERSEVPCTNEDCTLKPRLVKVYRSRVTWDIHRCPACKAEYDHQQFINAKAQHLHAEGSERYVLVTDAIEATEIPKNTMRSWMRRMVVKSSCDIKSRRVMVWWPDVRDEAREWRTKRKVS